MTDHVSGFGSAATLEPFSRATSVRAVQEGLLTAELSGEWTIVGRPNGGYLLALLGRAAAELLGTGQVMAASAHFLRSPQPGPVEIEGEVLRRGRLISQVRVRMVQDGRSCVEALMSLGELDPAAEPRWDAGVADVPYVSFEDSVRLAPVTPDGSRVALFEQVDVRLDPDSMGGIIAARPSGLGQLRGWLKLLGDEDFDPISLLYAVDAFPPTTFDTDFSGMVSTVELTAYIRAVPAPGPLRVVNSARLIDHHCVDEMCDIWDATGRLVAQATQLAVVPSS